MPRGDRTGPNGMGPMTGRAAGLCAGNATPGFTNPVPRGGGAWGRGGGWGVGHGARAGRGGGGGGWGRRHWFYATGMPGWQRAAYGSPPYGVPAGATPPASELEVLKGQAANLADELAGIRTRIDNLEQQKREP